MKVELCLQVENNSKFVRGKSKVRNEIEQFILSQFAMEKLDKHNCRYILSIPYTSDENSTVSSTMKYELHHLVKLRGSNH